jgi:hypothetical protein
LVFPLRWLNDKLMKWPRKVKTIRLY